jgi:hypothetical protein
VSGSIDRARRFLDAYSTVEDVLRRRLDTNGGGRSRFYELVDQAVKGKFVSDQQGHRLKKAGDLRNVIVHERGSWGGDPVADPREDFVVWLERQADVISKPPLVRTVLKLKQPSVLDENEDLTQFLSLVKRYDFSQAPVRRGDGTLALVTTNALARWIATAHEPGEGFLAADATIAEILKFSEDNDRLVIRSRDLTAVEAARTFAGNACTIAPAAILLTERGKRSETPLGICVRADVAVLLAAIGA